MRGVRTGKNLREGEVALTMAPPLRKHLLDARVLRGAAPRGSGVQGGFSFGEGVEEVGDGEGSDRVGVA